MNDIEKKKAHAASVIEAIEALKVSITNHEAGLWFGGYPPLFIQIQNFTDHMRRQIETTFELPITEQEPQQEEPEV